jgi:predicted Zn-dependent peptidase
MAQPVLKTTEAGMRVVMVPMEGLNSVTVLGMAGVGSRYEEPDKAGISHFLEHLPFKGTKNYPTSMDIAVAIDGVGGKHNAFTGKEYTGYWVKVGSDKLNLALDVVSDLMQTAELRPEDIDKERGVIIEEINMYEDQPRPRWGMCLRIWCIRAHRCQGR